LDLLFSDYKSTTIWEKNLDFMSIANKAEAMIGSPDAFWYWSPDEGWDLTHSSTSERAHQGKQRLHLHCEISNITIDPRKTALVVIDMQNYSMCSSLGSSIVVPSVLKAERALLRYAIPGARTAGIQILWLNWGLNEEDLTAMPPCVLRVFNWRANSTLQDYGISKKQEGMIQCGERLRDTSLGMDLGQIITPEGTKVDAGRALMKDTWNAALHGPLQSCYERGRDVARPDVLLHKKRNSGFNDGKSELDDYIKQHGIRTLVFGGMNTDQCVMATLQDAHSRGYDTILLADGCATDSPSYSQQCAEFNCCRNWGFLSTCQALALAAERYSSQKQFTIMS
jgi:nicotinamidase-related amidase